MIHTTVQFGRSISEERAQATMQDAGIAPSSPFQWAYQFWYDDIWTEVRDDSVSRPQRRLVTAKSTNLELTISDENSDLIAGSQFVAEFCRYLWAWSGAVGQCPKFSELWDK